MFYCPVSSCLHSIVTGQEQISSFYEAHTSDGPSTAVPEPNPHLSISSSPHPPPLWRNAVVVFRVSVLQTRDPSANGGLEEPADGRTRWNQTQDPGARSGLKPDLDPDSNQKGMLLIRIWINKKVGIKSQNASQVLEKHLSSKRDERRTKERL